MFHQQQSILLVPMSVTRSSAMTPYHRAMIAHTILVQTMPPHCTHHRAFTCLSIMSARGERCVGENHHCAMVVRCIKNAMPHHCAHIARLGTFLDSNSESGDSYNEE